MHAHIFFFFKIKNPSHSQHAVYAYVKEVISVTLHINLFKLSLQITYSVINDARLECLRRAVLLPVEKHMHWSKFRHTHLYLGIGIQYTYVTYMYTHSTSICITKNTDREQDVERKSTRVLLLFNKSIAQHMLHVKWGQSLVDGRKRFEQEHAGAWETFKCCQKKN